MRILLLSPYDAMSHIWWREMLVAAFPLHDWEVVTLPPRYFSWRFRGNSLTFAFDQRLQGHFDAIVATSMTDYSALLGMSPGLAGIPSFLYFHENQFAYPGDRAGNNLLQMQLTSIYSGVAAGTLVFNSEFNRDSFMVGSRTLLGAMPDGVPKGLVDQLFDKSYVIPVPVMPGPERGSQKSKKMSVVWNHRWEYDKGLDELLQMVTGLATDKMDLVFHLVGQGFRQEPEQIEQARQVLQNANMLGKFGFIPKRSEYLELLSTCDVVFSTARQEFQGLAVLEAVASGCVPLVPDGLAYREFVPAVYRYEDLDHARSLLIQYQHKFEQGTLVAPPLPDQVLPEAVQAAWSGLLADITV